MKKHLSITGKILLERKEIVQIVSRHIKETEGLVVERVICVDKTEEACEFENMILFVHEEKKDPIAKKYDGPKKSNQPKGVTRPNYGVGKFLTDLLADGEVHSLEEIYQDVKDKFPKMTKKLTTCYLSRPLMVGDVLRTGDSYLKEKKK